MSVPETTLDPSALAPEATEAKPRHLWVVPPDGHPEPPEAVEPPELEAAGEGDAADDAGGAKAVPPFEVRVERAFDAALAVVVGKRKQPPTLAERLEYSKQGDWAPNPTKARRQLHACLMRVAFGLTWCCERIVGWRGALLDRVESFYLRAGLTVLAFGLTGWCDLVITYCRTVAGFLLSCTALFVFYEIAF